MFTLLFRSCGNKEPEATISQMEVRLHIANFINSALNHDPEISVLFNGRDGESECSSDSYEIEKDVVFWLSVSAAILAICLICIIVSLASTNIGRYLVTGRKSKASVKRNLGDQWAQDRISVTSGSSTSTEGDK